jgi:hypothetical protein
MKFRWKAGNTLEKMPRGWVLLCLAILLLTSIEPAFGAKHRKNRKAPNKKSKAAVRAPAAPVILPQLNDEEPTLDFIPDDLLASLSHEDLSTLGKPFTTHQFMVWNLAIPELAQARALVNARRHLEAVSLLQDRLSTASEPQFLREALVDTLILQADIYLEEQSRNVPNQLRDGFFEHIFPQALAVGEHRIDVWRCFLDYLAFDAQNRSRLKSEGLRLLVGHWVALAGAAGERWVHILRELYAGFDAAEEFLARYKVAALLSLIPSTSSEFKAALPAMEQEIRGRMLELTADIEVAVRQGKMDEAGFCLMVLDKIAPDSLPLKNAWDAFFREKNLQFCLSQARQALEQSEWQQVTVFINQGREIATGDSRLESLERRLIERRDGAESTRVALSPEQQQHLANFLKQLAAAERDGELATASRILAELRTHKFAFPGMDKKIETIRYQLLASRQHLPERLAEARRLFSGLEWEALKRYLNQNPELVTSPATAEQVREMVFAVRWYLESPEPRDFLAQARKMAHLYPDTFYPLYVLGSAALKAGDHVEAGIYLEKAAKIRPDHPDMLSDLKIVRARQRKTWGLGLLVSAGVLLAGFGAHFWRRHLGGQDT